VIVEHVPPEPPNFPRADRIRLTLVNENNSGVGGYGQVWTEPEHLRLIGLGLVRAADHFGSPTPPPSPQPVRQALRSVWARLRNPDV
jgi:hypothetical protein